MTELETKYKEQIRKELKEKLGIKNEMAVPNLSKIIVNAGIGNEYKTNSKADEEMQEIISMITGQKAVITKAKEAIANFKLREGMPNGVMVTLRKDLMWNFIYKLININLPRVKDFRGISVKSFDGRGGYTLGISDYTIFPEIDTTKVLKIRSIQVVIQTTGKTTEETRALLEALGMPFRKDRKVQ